MNVEIDQIKGMTIGYIRVSTIDQNSNRQLEKISVHKIFKDECSGKTLDRPAYREMMSFIREGDKIVCHSIDRLSRSIVDLKSTIQYITSIGASIEFIKEGLTFGGPSTPISNLLLNVLGTFAEFEAEIIKERQREGIALAKIAGKYKGRKPSLNSEDVEYIKERLNAGDTKASIARTLGVSRETIYSYLRVHK